MPTWFQEKKARILQQLALPEHDYTDASPKGSVDEPIRQLIADINNNEGLVTTSSCSGRVAVYLDGPSKCIPDVFNAETKEGSSGNSGGKGGGSWCFVSHESVSLADYASGGSLIDLLGLHRSGLAYPPLNIKILHVLCSDCEHAQMVLSAALEAGFRESGVSGNIVSSGQKPTMPMVAVRSSGLAFDSLIAFQELETSELRAMVSEDYLRVLINVANERFVTNNQRKERFCNSLAAKLEQSRRSGSSRGRLESRTPNGAPDHAQVLGKSEAESSGIDEDEEIGMPLLMSEDA